MVARSENTSRIAGVPKASRNRRESRTVVEGEKAGIGVPQGTLFVIPGWSEGPDPESRDSGFDASHRPGMTTITHATSAAPAGELQLPCVFNMLTISALGRARLNRKPCASWHPSLRRQFTSA